MAAVADQLFGSVLKVLYPVETRVLPRRISAGHRRDVFVAHLFEDLSGEERPDASRAICDDRRVLVRHCALDFNLEKAPGEGDSLFQMPLAPLVLLPDIKQDGRLAVILQQLVYLLSGYFGDILARIGHDLLKT